MEFAGRHAWPFTRVVFLAPLVRPAGWLSVHLGHTALHRFTESLERTFNVNSSDLDFLAFVPFAVLTQAANGLQRFRLQAGIWFLYSTVKVLLVVGLLLQGGGLLMGVLYVGNAVKISFFGGPIMPDDVYALRSLLLVLEGWHFVAAAIPLASIAALLVFNFTLRHWSAYASLVLVILLGMTLAYQPAVILDPLDRHPSVALLRDRCDRAHGRS